MNMVYIPPPPPQDSPPIVENCTYQIKIQNDTFKCFTKEEYEKRQADKVAQDEKVAKWMDEYWWAVLIGILCFMFLLFLLSSI